ncbi:MAG: lysylphosphatidylglycerol synthase domain-containing protein [Nocardioidaceae bacterium]
MGQPFHLVAGLLAPGPLLAAYGVANLLALLPLTPGGIGVAEGVLVPALVTFGAPQSAALLGVPTWRLAEYLLPIPLALVTYVSLRAGRPRAHA